VSEPTLGATKKPALLRSTPMIYQRERSSAGAMSSSLLVAPAVPFCRL
jgi:hypothetical protein